MRDRFDKDVLFHAIVNIHFNDFSQSKSLSPHRQSEHFSTPELIIRRFWTKIFAISFVVGTVTGIVLEFEFGTNFAAFSTAAGELFGGPLAVEGMMAFMLEATFLGVFVFGRERVGDALYFVSSVAVGLGTWLSAVWILIANSWMQTPRGYEVVTENGQPVIHLVDPLAAYFTPRFGYMYVHMQNAAVESVALFMAGVAAYFVFRHHVWGYQTQHVEFWEVTLKIALVALLITAPLQVLHGDMYGRHVAETQPQKFAAMEAVWETEAYVPEYLVAVPTSLDQLTDPRAKELFGIGIPGGASWLASGGDPSAEIRGLETFESEAPPVAIVFWAFRGMVGLGFWSSSSRSGAATAGSPASCSKTACYTRRSWPPRCLGSSRCTSAGSSPKSAASRG